MKSILKYIDETDKSYGIAGMAISLVACDCEDMLSSVSLEENEEPLEMAGEFFFSGNPRISAKIAWSEVVRQYQVAGSLLLGNVMCRRLCRGMSMEQEILTAIHDVLVAEGAASCELEADEVDRLYRDKFSYFQRLFSHPGVRGVADEFATSLRACRRMTAGEALDHLRRLSHL